MISPSRLTLTAATTACLLAFSTLAGAADAGNVFWHETRLEAADARAAAATAGRVLVGPGRTLTLDTEAFRALMDRAPMEGTTEARAGAIVFPLPLPEGGFSRFRIEESPVMEPALAARFPEIRTFRGQGINDPTASVRFDWTPAGFHAMVLSAGRTLFVDPNAKGDVDHYVVYDKKDYRRATPVSFRCETTGSEVTDASLAAELREQFGAAPNAGFGNALRTYKLALAADAEYTAAACAPAAPDASCAMAAMATALDRVNGIYEREVAVHLSLVGNDDVLIYTDPATDPYTNNDGQTMLSQNQAAIDLLIGNSNYDIGHVFSTGGGGISHISSVCQTGFKAQGVTGLPSPTGDTFYVDFVAHEIGHQFGANHTFNGTMGNCGGVNRNASTAWEPGSGSTIMSYAGSCGSENVQTFSNDYFHGGSLQEINAYIAAGGACGVGSGSNNPPTVSAGSSFSIPTRTPFTLTATGILDSDGDAVTIDWEQLNAGGANSAPPDNDGDGKLRPLFRSLPPTTSPARTFPALASILNGSNAGSFESLPTKDHTGGQSLTFLVTARDNHPGLGATANDQTTISVVGTAGPFAVTAPNTSVVWPAGSTQTVTWSVAGTTDPPIGVAFVKISLSTDGGHSFLTDLVASAPNTGTATVTLPDVVTTQARVKVEAIGNIFFDISNANFTIKPGLFVSNAPAVTEGNLGTTVPANFTVSLFAASTQQVAVHYATADGTATGASGDYVAQSGDLTFKVGDPLTKPVSVLVKGDTLFETNETFFLNLSSPTNAVVTTAQGVATINNDDAPPVVSIADATPMAEGNSGTKDAVFTVSVTPLSGAPTLVPYATADGTATAADNDYVPLSGTLTIPAGQLTGIIKIPVKGDAIIESDETFFVNLGTPVNATLGDGQAVGTILNDDKPGQFLFGAANYKVSESTASATILVKRVDGNAAGATVQYDTFDGTATGAGNQDYTPITSGVLTFGGNQVSQSFKVPITKDAIDEGDETVILRLSNPQPASLGAALGAPSTAVLTITDNDTGGKIQFSSASYSVSEGAGSVKLTVKRTGGLASGVSVPYSITPDGTPGAVTATDGADYNSAGATPPGAVTFASSGAGATTQTITIPILQDAIAEGAETFKVILGTPTGGAVLGLPAFTTATVTILDDEPTVEFSAANYSVKESQASALITVKRSGPPVGIVTVNYATADGTAVSTGLNPDYVPAVGTLTFPNGMATRSFTVPIVKDTLVEGPETVNLSLTSPVGIAPGAKTTATLTIADDDATPTLQFSAASYTVNEATPKATLMVKRTGTVADVLTVEYAVTGGSATNGGVNADYNLTSPGTLTFAKGVTTQTILVPIVNDAIDEGTETATLQLQNAVNLDDPGHVAFGANVTTTLNITDNEPTVQFSAAAYSVSEAAKSIALTVKRTGPLTAPATVQYDVTGGSAINGADYTLAPSGILSFAVGKSTATLPITLDPDTIADGPRTIDLDLSLPSGAMLGTPSSTVVTIKDNDKAGTVQFSVASYSVAETAGTATITVTRSGGTSSQATVHYSTSDGTATAPTDYTTTANTLTFGLNEKSKTFTVPVVDDGTPDSGAVSVNLLLDTPANGLAVGANSTATLWIVRE